MKVTVIQLVYHRLMLGNLTKMDQPLALFLNKILISFVLSFNSSPVQFGRLTSTSCDYLWSQRRFLKGGISVCWTLWTCLKSQLAMEKRTSFAPKLPTSPCATHQWRCWEVGKRMSPKHTRQLARITPKKKTPTHQPSAPKNTTDLTYL